MNSPDTPLRSPAAATAPKAAASFPRSGADIRGAALVIVLSFVVLIVGMVLAFFSLATSERQVSDSSSSEVKVNLLAQGAGEQILADLEQEIVAGSTNIGTASNPAYLPKSFTNMIQAMPARSGTNGSGSLPPNVLKRSARSQPFYPATGYDANAPTRASSDSSTNATRSGRSFTLARWNAPLLLPKQNGTSSTDLTPVTSGSNGFVAPDWIYVTARGSNPVLSGSVPAANAANGSDPVIGRYAYVIYHEGGLLDMNMAGSPPISSSDTNHIIISVGAKPLPSYVDLTALPGVGTNDPVTGAASLSAANQTNLSALLVGWRNYASSAASGTMGTLASPGYTFSSVSNYFTNMIGATNGFLTTAGVPLNGGQSDRIFTSRQQLIRFLSDAAGDDASALASLQNALQYMGTFSRSLDQPSYIPPLWYDSNAPRITNGVGTAPAYTDYRGGNSAWTNTFRAETNINVAFPRTLVTASFTRNVSDPSGNTTAVANVEPLVKKRFPLERMAWLTYMGPSAARSLSDPDMVSLRTNPGVTPALLAQGTAANIQRSFGLTWNAAGYWEYNPASGGSNSIATLGSLTGTREPNFAELLKASIALGSLGISTGVSGSSGFAQSYSDITNARRVHLQNATVDHHVLRIMANIMDQADADGYPTTIRFASSSPNPTNQVYLINGTENLPYIYRTRFLLVRAKEGTFTNSAGVVATWPLSSSTNSTNSTIITPGVGVMLMIPEIWNPHDQNSSLGTPYPTSLRIVAESVEGISTDFPAAPLPNNTRVFRPGVGQRLTGTTGGDLQNDCNTYMTLRLPPGWPRPAPRDTNMTMDNTALLITYATNSLFRDPTSLHTAGVPVGSGLSLSPTHILQPGNFANIPSNAAAISLFANVVQSDGSGVKEGTNDPNPGRIGFYVGCVPLLQQCYSITTRVTNVQNPMTGVVTTSTNIVTNRVVGAGDFSGDFSTSSVSVFGGISYTNRITVGGFTGSSASFNYGTNWRNWDVATIAPNTAAGAFTLRLEYANPITPGTWCDYDVKNWDISEVGAATDPRELKCARLTEGGGLRLPGFMTAAYGIDPRTGRFGLIFGRSGGGIPNYHTPNSVWMGNSGPMNMTVSNSLTIWANTNGNTMAAARHSATGYMSFPANNYGFRRSSTWPAVAVSENELDRFAQNTAANKNYYPDADGVIRGGMGEYAPGVASSQPLLALPTISPSTFTGSGTNLVITPTAQSQSRPMILNRPFRSVAELGYVFSDLPWRHLDFFSPESGNMALLDTFCIRDQTSTNALSAGKVSLNSRQAPVFQAVMAGGMIDELLRSGTSARTLSDTNAVINAGAISSMATNFASRNVTNMNYNIADIVGRWVSGTGSNAVYDGFSSSIDLGNATNNAIQRFREAPIRALANTGQTRVWNLMIDVVAQTGKFPAGASALDQFVVSGEKRLWLHVAIDRITGQILDTTVEPVNE